MTPTLLLDLDDTLLSSNMDAFIAAYFKKLAGFLAGRVNPARLVQELLTGTMLMFKNEYPYITLEETFSDYFYPALGANRPELQAHIERFYDEIFPSLKDLTSPRPEAVELVNWARAQGWRIAIATNPLFPRKAIDHRLRWAGLPPDTYPFELVTSFETIHFTKEIPAYYHEIMGRLGWPEGPVVMVGDDAKLDIESALVAGFPVYWIRPHGQSLPDMVDIAQGTVRDFHAWIQTVDTSTLQVDFGSPTALIASLQATPAVLDTIVRGLKLSDWTTRPQESEWAFTEIICHMRDVDADVNVSRVRTVLTEENAVIAGQVTDPWAEERQYIQQDGLAAFHDFMAVRMELVDALKGLTPEDWQRKARHTIFGPTNLLELVKFMVEHDHSHLQQALAAVKKKLD
jgi:FMN phosphatase YigB (HAD superfamily)